MLGTRSAHALHTLGTRSAVAYSLETCMRLRTFRGGRRRRRRVGPEDNPGSYNALGLAGASAAGSGKFWLDGRQLEDVCALLGLALGRFG